MKTKIQKIITEREKTKPNIMWKRKGKGNKEKWIVIIQWEERREKREEVKKSFQLTHALSQLTAFGLPPYNLTNVKNFIPGGHDIS